jgi:DNA-binding NarL/FixJ family response regulator
MEQRVPDRGTKTTRSRILLADDHPNICKSVAALLGPEFDVVGMVTNGRDLLTEAHRLQPDVVILDISMPSMDGLEAATRLCASTSTIKVMFLTEHDDEEFIRAGLASGAIGYVVKSRLTSDLITCLHEILAGHSFISPALHGSGKWTIS